MGEVLPRDVDVRETVMQGVGRATPDAAEFQPVLGTIDGELQTSASTPPATEIPPGRRVPVPPDDRFPLVDVTLADVVTLLLEQSPRLTAILAEADIAEAERLQAELLPNPDFNYEGFSHLRGSQEPIERRQDMYTVSQPMLLFGQRQARRAATARQAIAARAGAYAEYAELLRDVRRLFATLLVQQEQVRVSSETREQIARVERIVAGRADAGLVSRYDLDRIQVEAVAFDTQLAAARAEAADASGELGRIIGLPNWRPRATGPLRPLDLAMERESLARALEQSHPAVVAARQAEAAARSGIYLASRERLPVPDFEVGVMQSDDPFGQFLYTGVSIPLMIYDRGQGMMAEAQAEARTALLRRVAASAETRAELERALRVLFELREALATYERDVRDRLPRMRQMAEMGYEAGEIGILELLDAINTFLDLQLTYLDYVEAVMHAEIDVLAAAGLVESHISP